MKKQICMMLAAITLSTAIVIPAYAQGWEKDTTGWLWQNADGTRYANGWQWIDENSDGIAECYYFDSNGYMLSNTTTPDGYTVNTDGVWVLDGVVQTQTISAENHTGYTKKINNTIWDLMDHTYAQNEQKYGKLQHKLIRHSGDYYYDNLPYRMTYYTGFLSEEEKADIKPYIIIANSQDVSLNTVFEDAPNIDTNTSLESIGNHLENLGYSVEWGKTSLGAADTCWITVDRFDIAFSVGMYGSFDIKVRQELSEKSAHAMWDAMNTQTSAH